MKISSIKFESVSFGFESHAPLIQSVDFDFPMNQILWIKAEVGTGKSSLLQILAGLENPQTGKYIINDANVTDMSFEEFLPLRMKIGYSFDYGGLINNKSLLDNLLLPLLYHNLASPEEAKNRCIQIMKDFGVHKFKDERPAHVPGRIRKLVCLMRSLVLEPDMLLMDDPSVGLGQDNIYTLVDYIHKLRNEGKAQHIFISSYDQKFMDLFEYQVIHMADGQLYFQAADELKKVVHL